MALTKELDHDEPRSWLFGRNATCFWTVVDADGSQQVSLWLVGEETLMLLETALQWEFFAPVTINTITIH